MILLDSLVDSLPLQSLYDPLGGRTCSKLHLLRYVLARLDCDRTGYGADQPEYSAGTVPILNEDNLLFLGRNLQTHAHILGSAELGDVTRSHVNVDLQDPLHVQVNIRLGMHIWSSSLLVPSDDSIPSQGLLLLI